MTPDSLDIWVPSGEHIVVAWYWQFERPLRETNKTPKKADEHTQAFHSDADCATILATIIQPPYHKITMQLAGVLLQKVNCCKVETFSYFYTKVSPKKVFCWKCNAEHPYSKNWYKLLDRTSLNTCELITKDNARFLAERARIDG